MLKLNDINGTAPGHRHGRQGDPEPAFSSIFIRTLYDVVRTAKTKDGIPAYLEQFIGTKGLVCKNPSPVKDYGFLPDPSCG